MTGSATKQSILSFRRGMDCFASLAMTVLNWPRGGKWMKQPCVYIVASKRHGTLYTGVTSNLPKRAFEHREGLVEGFSAKYGCRILVWYEVHETMIAAITREKQIKAGSRAKKLTLIETSNPEWEDLYKTLI
jgi:putative endonuclease